MAELQEAIDALRAGNKREAQQILSKILKQNPNDEKAWLWLSQAARTDAQRRVCLEQVLRINPDSQSAKNGLMHLQRLQSPSPAGNAGEENVPPAAEKRPQLTAPGAKASLARSPSPPTPVPALSQEPRIPRLLRRVVASLPFVDEDELVGFGRDVRSLAQAIIHGLANTRVIAGFRTKINEYTGISLGELAGVALFAAGIVMLLLLMGFIINRHAAWSLLREIIEFSIILIIVTVLFLLLLMAIGWFIEKRSGTTTALPPALAGNGRLSGVADRVRSLAQMAIGGVARAWIGFRSQMNERKDQARSRVAGSDLQSSTPSRAGQSIPVCPQCKQPRSESKFCPYCGYAFAEQVRAADPSMTAENVSQAISARFPEFDCRVNSLLKNMIVLKKGSLTNITIVVHKGKVSPLVPILYPGLGFWGWVIMLLSSPFGCVPGMIVITAYYNANLKKQEQEVIAYLDQHFAN